MIEEIEWVSCDARLPDPGDEVLIFGPGAGVYIGTFDDGDQLPEPHFRDVDDYPIDYEVTHWAKFPDGPGLAEAPKA